MVGRQGRCSAYRGSVIGGSELSATICTRGAHVYGRRLQRGSKGLSRIEIFAAAFLFSTGGAAIKACSLTSWQVAGFRSGIAAVALYLFLPGARRGWTWRTGLVGVAYAATLILFVLANKLTTSANGIFLQSTAPLYLLFLGPLVLHEAIRKVDIAVFSAVVVGVLLLLSGTENAAATAPDPHLGNMFAVASGATWALTLTGLRWMAKRSESGTAVVIAGNVIAFVVCLPITLPVSHASMKDAAILLYLGTFQIGLAYVFLTRSLVNVPGLEAATLLLLEPVFNPLWTWAVNGERPSAPAMAGGAIILGAALTGTWWQTKFTRISQVRYISPDDI
jgi:DME family drug/metabolite transporter